MENLEIIISVAGTALGLLVVSVRPALPPLKFFITLEVSSCETHILACYASADNGLGVCLVGRVVAICIFVHM